MPSINTSLLGEVPVNLPPLSEQKAIAAVLGSLDNKIELLRKQNETLEALAQTLFKRWFIDFNFPCLLAYGKRTQACLHNGRNKELAIYGHKDYGGLPQPEDGKCFVYVLRLENGNRYVGMTDFLLRRYHEHKTGKGAKATKASPPVAMIHFEAFDSREAAAEREQWLKTGFGRKWLDREEAKGNLGAHVMQAPMIASEFGEIPEGWEVGNFEEDGFSLTMGQSPSGSSYNEEVAGVLFFQDRAEFGWRFPSPRLYTTEPSRMAEEDDILLSVRAPVGDVNLAIRACCVGRGLCAISHSLRSYALYKIKSLTSFFDQYNQEGTVFGSISKKDFQRRELIIPNVKLADTFNQIVLPKDTKIKANFEQIQTLTQLRDTLLPKMMKGEIRIAL